MTLNINKERNELIQVINDITLDLSTFKENIVSYNRTRINFLWLVLKLTIKYPQVELYLKNLLDYFTINELKNICSGWSILHYMCKYPFNISLNAFEIIINYGIDVNIKNKCNNTAIYHLFYNRYDNHVNNILNLLISHGINLNIVNNCNNTVLDILLRLRKVLNEETKKSIMILINCGRITNNPKKYCFTFSNYVEHCKCSSVKPAIKNENKI